MLVTPLSAVARHRLKQCAVLPREVAQRVCQIRSGTTALLFVVDRASGAVEHHHFAELPHLLPPRSLLVVNNSQVVKAALRRTLDDGTYLHIVSPFQTDLGNVTCLCPWKPAVGSPITVNGGRFIVEGSPEAGRDLRQGRLVPDNSSITTLQEFMERYGEVPIPIYVNAHLRQCPARAGQR